MTKNHEEFKWIYARHSLNDCMFSCRLLKNNDQGCITLISSILLVLWKIIKEEDMSIIISKNQKDAVKIKKSPFKDEDYLQKYIHDNPDVIPLYDIDENIKILILAREFPSQSGPIDAIGIDQHGNIYLIETKLYKNPDKRTVVAQVLDYGASLWKHSIEFSDFTNKINKQIQSNFEVSLEERLAFFFEFDDDEVANLLDKVSVSLSNGLFKFVVLMDTLQDSLKDLVMFINQNSNFDIFAVEVEYYQYENMEIMIPKVFGGAVKKNTGKATYSGKRRTWNEQDFFEELKKNVSQTESQAATILYEFTKRTCDEMRFGTGATTGSFSPYYSKYAGTCFTFYTSGGLVLNFSYEKDDPETPKIISDFRDKLKNKDVKYNAQMKYPPLTSTKWGPKVNDIIDILTELMC